jgi:hypothetical protein
MFCFLLTAKKESKLYLIDSSFVDAVPVILVFVRSVLYDLKSYESAIALTPIQLPPRSKVMEVAVSNTHIIVLTSGLLTLYLLHAP